MAARVLMAPLRAIGVVLALAFTLTVRVAGAHHCQQLATHFSVLATHDTPGPWAAELTLRRHTHAHGSHAQFGMRPSSSGPAEKLTITLAGVLPLEDAIGEEDGYEEAERGGWYKVHRERVTWAEARDACAAESAHLVVVDSPEEAAALRALLARHEPHASRELHAGFYASDYPASFRTVQGQTLSASGYEGWGPGQPDMSICGRVDQQGLLRDGMCDWVEPASFVCERSPWRAADSDTRVPAPGPAPAPDVTLPPATPSVAPEGYEPVAPQGGHSVYKLHVQPATWWQARHTCTEEGARLAVLNSETESYVVGELVRRASGVLPYVYVGASAQLHFITVFGQPLPQARSTLWASGYPAFKNCVAVNHNGTLWVTQCWAKYPFLCEYDAS